MIKSNGKEIQVNANQNLYVGQEVKVTSGVHPMYLEMKATIVSVLNLSPFGHGTIDVVTVKFANGHTTSIGAQRVEGIN